MRKRALIAMVAGAVTLGLVAETAVAADFSPTIEFGLSDRKANSNPALSVSVAQDDNEEELDYVELRIPAGFTLARDEQIPGGTQVGGGQIVIHAGPGCRPGSPTPDATAPITVGVEILEKDRTPAEVGDGVVAIYVVDLSPVTTIPLMVRGSQKAGYTLAGTIPPNDNTCPPFSFFASFLQEAAGNPILVNPPYGGAYTFGARFVSLNGSISESQQVITIDGPSKKKAKKKCKKIKNKKKRRKCKKGLL